MTNVPVTKQENALSTETLSDWGAEESLSGNDIVIPQILLMQGMSKAVEAGKAVVGEFRDSTNNELVGKNDKPFVCIPFYMQKVWDVYDKEKNKWAKTIPVVVNPLSKDYNDNWNMEQTIDGKVMKIVKRFNIFVLRPDRIANSPAALPSFISFKSTSFRNGRTLATQMFHTNVKELGLTPASFTIVVGADRTQNDKGVFMKMNWTLGEKSTPEQVEICNKWAKTLSGGKVEIDDSEVRGAASAETSQEF